MGILGNLFKDPSTMDRMALAFNQLRMDPDPNLAGVMQGRQAMRQQQAGRDAAMEFFKGKPGTDGYLAALGAGGDGSSLIQNYISAQNTAARSTAGTVDRNRSVELLRKKCGEGDTDACEIADMIEAGGNAGQLLGIYYQSKRTGEKQQRSKIYPGGLEIKHFGDGTTKYFKNGVELVNQDDIMQAQVDAQDFEAQGKGKNKGAELEAKEVSQMKVAIRGVRERIEATSPLVEELLNHPGMEPAVGTLARSNYEPNFFAEGHPSRDFITKYKQLAGKIFLSAFEGLKGGGQITELEGQKAEEAASSISRTLSADQLRGAMRQYMQDLVSQHQRLIIQYQNAKAQSEPQPLPDDLLQFPDNL
jgi:hypothetical protein